MARPKRTDVRARHYLLSGDHSPCGVGGIDQLESFGFRGRKSCIKNVEIFAVGKIAEFARFAGGERRKSPDRFSFNRAAASYGWEEGCRSVGVQRSGNRMTIV